MEKVPDERAESRVLLGAKNFDIMRNAESSMDYASESCDGLFNRHWAGYLGSDAKT